ncbi:MAG TPA: ankyrin repeat domain-containing protein [Puia sp.]|nr:ankyrin repeat domain-containing protein [Puia sp.]
MDYLKKIIGEIEVHSVEGIKECFAAGISPNSVYNGQPLIYELTSEYLRSARFKYCVKAFIEYGLVFEDNVLLAVLMDDVAVIESQISADPSIPSRRYTLRTAFTPLLDASLLHICAEFNCVSCAKVLVANGADVNARAGIDENGFGGQTPIFHTVNQILNQSKEMLEYLLLQSADLKLTVAGLIWGKSYEWETLIPAVNPISYAMMGLLPQMHRKESEISEIVNLLLKASYNIDYQSVNVPNKYLQQT